MQRVSTTLAVSALQTMVTTPRLQDVNHGTTIEAKAEIHNDNGQQWHVFCAKQ